MFEMLTPRAIIIILYIGLIQTRLACLHITLVVTLDYNNKMMCLQPVGQLLLLIYTTDFTGWWFQFHL